MTVGASLILIAVGAILRYAVTASVAGLNIQTAGLVLMIVGFIGLVFAVYFAARGGWRSSPRRE